MHTLLGHKYPFLYIFNFHEKRTKEKKFIHTSKAFCVGVGKWWVKPDQPNLPGCNDRINCPSSCVCGFGFVLTKSTLIPYHFQSQFRCYLHFPAPPPCHMVHFQVFFKEFVSLLLLKLKLYYSKHTEEQCHSEDLRFKLIHGKAVNAHVKDDSKISYIQKIKRKINSIPHTRVSAAYQFQTNSQ